MHIALFELVVTKNCNLHCDFCYLKNVKNKRPTKQTIDRIITELTNQVVCLPTNVVIVVNLMGGELIVYKDLFEHYDRIYQTIKQLTAERNQQFVYNFYSNLIGSKSTIDEMIKLVNHKDVFLYTSYDVVGRFKSNKQKQLWIDNLQYVTERIPNKPIVSICGGYSNIQAIINKTDDALNSIIDQYTIDIEPCFDSGSSTSEVITSSYYKQFVDYVYSNNLTDRMIVDNKSRPFTTNTGNHYVGCDVVFESDIYYE